MNKIENLKGIQSRLKDIKIDDMVVSMTLVLNEEGMEEDKIYYENIIRALTHESIQKVINKIYHQTK